MKEKLKALGLVLAACIVSFVISGIWLLLLTLLLEYFRAHDAFEAQLFVDSFLKPVALVWVASWVLLSGVFLKRPGPIKWGRRMLYVYLAVCVIPYFLSFGVKPGG